MNKFLFDILEREEKRFEEWCKENNIEYSKEENSQTRAFAKMKYDEFFKQKEQEEKEQRKKEQEAQRLANIKNNIENFERRIPTIYKGADISDFSNALQGKINSLLEGRNALILGENGVGKTHLAWAILRKLVKEGKRVKYVKAQSLLYDIKSANNPYRHVTEQYGNGVDTLVIDETDKIFESKADFIYLNYLVDNRYEWVKQTIFIGNGNTKQFIESLGQSIYSRLRANNGLDISLNGADKRLEKE